MAEMIEDKFWVRVVPTGGGCFLVEAYHRPANKVFYREADTLDEALEHARQFLRWDLTPDSAGEDDW